MTEKFTEGAEPSLCKLEIQANSCGVSMGLNLSLHMWETVVKLGLSVGPLAIGLAFIPGA